MKTILIQPPEWNSLWMPHSSLPSIAAALRNADIETIQQDWNIEIFDELLAKEPLTELWEKTDWGAGYERTYPGVHSPEEVVAHLKKRIDEVTGSIEDAIALFRDGERFYMTEEYAKAQETLNDAILLVTTSAWALEERLVSPEAALKAAMDPSINIYLPYLRKRVESALGENPDMVGLSVTLPRQFIPAISAARLFKEARPGLHVVLGGAYPTMVAHAIENSPVLFDAFDSVALSEGEVAAVGLANCVEKGDPVGDIPGILFRKNEEVKRSSLPVMVDADDLPAMDFDGLPLDKYLSPETVLPAFSSRGCYWRKCTFCARPDRRGFSQRSPAQVIKDLTTYSKKHKCRFAHFTDNTVRPRRMAAIADGVVEAGLEVSWTARTRFGPELTMDWCDRAAAGGLVRIIFGMESASKRMVDLMRKGFRVEEIPNVLQALSKAGIDATLYLMVGFPTETKEEAAKTLKFIEELQDTLTPFAQYYISPFGVAHSSPIHKEPQKYEISAAPQPAPDDLRNPYCFNFETSKGMNRAEMEGAYIEFREKLADLTRKHVPMPHDMLMRKLDAKEATAARKGPPVLKMNSILKLADDLRADRGCLLKGDKKFRIDEQLKTLIELLDSKKKAKEILRELGEANGTTTANAFIFVQQLLEEGVIVAGEKK